jgi:hypothetical protein
LLAAKFVESGGDVNGATGATIVASIFVVSERKTGGIPAIGGIRFKNEE